MDASSVKIVSWNLLRRTGAGIEDLARLIESERPDLLLMQEVTADLAGLCDRVGGHFVRAPMPRRIHGLAVWSPAPLPTPPVAHALQAGTIFRRICQVIALDGFAVVNVHLSHGQVLNRRQLRRIAGLLPDRTAILGDFNIVGPHLVPGYRDVGPRRPTHLMAEVVPLRLDRCLVKGMVCTDARALPRRRSDHRPIVVTLTPDTLDGRDQPQPARGMARLIGQRRRAAA